MATKSGKQKAHQRTLTLETIGELAGGQAKATINAALRSALRDIEDRGADKSWSERWSSQQIGFAQTSPRR